MQINAFDKLLGSKFFISSFLFFFYFTSQKKKFNELHYPTLNYFCIKLLILDEGGLTGSPEKKLSRDSTGKEQTNNFEVLKGNWGL